MAEIADALQRLLEDPEVQAAAEGEDKEGEPSPALGAAAGLLPPELMAKLPMLMSTLGPMLGKNSGKKDEKTALLLALKPYMSPQRCEAIDMLVTLGRIGEIMRQLH